MNQQQMLERVVENALDFLDRSLSEFESHPKFSVIHFHAAVELFLKARLMAEHWSLAVTKRQEPDWKKFEAGDFQSVSLDEAADKLDKIVQSGLTKQEHEAFRGLARHRNKMMHFFHEVQTEEENKELLRGIAREQLNAWYLLHRLLIDRWSNIFSTWSKKLKKFNEKLRKHHEYLKVVYDNIEPEIRQRKANGAVFTDCPSCGFPSREEDDAIDEIYQARCLVCELTETCVSIECPNCSDPVTFASEGFATCNKCGSELKPEHLADALIDDVAAHNAAKDGDDSWDLGNCSDCDGYHTVIRIDDSYFCTSCFGEFESLDTCGWCNEPNTGDMEHSYYGGCNFCEGKAGWDAGKDD